MKAYDVIVIGAGAAGLGSSGVANVLGLKTLLIEQDANNFGGDCTNTGCVPSKALIHIANQFYQATKAVRFGLKTSGKADMGKILDHISQMQQTIVKTEDAEALRKKGIDVRIGKAIFITKDVVSVGDDTFTARVILLCTGSSPKTLSIKGMNAVDVYTNENIFTECRELPENLIVIGGGPIGCELGQAFSRLGSQVTIINRGNRLLSKEPESVSEVLEAQFLEEGIRIFNNAEVSLFEDGLAHITSSKNETDIQTTPATAVLFAVGRTVNSSNMGLEVAGITLTEKGNIKVDTYLQTTNKKVYVIGDAAASYMFSHGAEKMVRQLWRNLLIPVFKKKNTLDDLSWVTFTDPQVAHFGLTEKQLNENGTAFQRQDQSFTHDDRAIVEKYTYGQLSLWLDSTRSIRRKKLLSGSMIAPHAGELIQELQLAKHAKLSISKINNRVYPYPVAARINQKTIGKVMEKARTPFKLKLARIAFKLFN